ncbi:MAG TPA: S53 family peptidase [Gaiellales bacterium]|nr:S53 family peptidase [Gaiellales bacterium]
MAPLGLLRRTCLPTLLAAALLACASPAQAEHQAQARVPGTKPAWANPSNRSGDASSSATVVFSVWLGWRNQGELDALLAGQQDPASPDYHGWLSPQEFRSRFAPRESDVRRVSGWLRDEHFDLVTVPDNHLFVTASGSVAQVEQAFHVNEALYRVDGETVRAPDADPVIPADLAPAVTAITGLDSAYALAEPRTNTAPPPPPTGKSLGPCSHYWGEKTSSQFPNPFAPGQPLPWLICGYTPSQIASAYGIDQLHAAGLDGRGETIAITGAFFSPTIRSDIQSFSRSFGLPAVRYSEVVAPGTLKYPKDPGETQNWYIEQALDVEWTHAIAPRARIVYVGAANTTRGLDQALNEVVDKRLADVVSNSWGMAESDASKGEVRALDSVFQQAQAQGMEMVFASGDDGDNVAATGHASAGFPDSSPLVTSVGGTSLAIGSAGQRLWETGWGTTESAWNGLRWAPSFPGSFLYGAGGGASALYAKPSYQNGIVPGTQRAEPDVSMVADPQTGVLFTQTWSKPNGGTEQKQSWIGGTSLSAPLMAALATLANQASGQSNGFLNPRLYALAGSGVFNDVTPSGGTLAVLRHRLNPDGTVSTLLRSLDRDSSLRTAAGWDDVTGLGTPRAVQLIDALR